MTGSRFILAAFVATYLLGMTLSIDTYRELSRRGHDVTPAMWVAVTVTWPAPVAYSLVRYSYRRFQAWRLERRWQALRDEAKALTERCNANPERCP